MTLTFLRNQITLATDRFLSSSTKLQDIDLLRRSKLVISFSISYTACGLILVPCYFILGAPLGALAILLSNLLIFLTVYLIKYTGSPIVAGNWVVANVYALLFFLTFISGGYNGPMLAWLASLPVLATILARKDSGRIWVGFVILQIMIFYFLDVSDFSFPVYLTPDALGLIRILSLICLTVLIWLFASLYEFFHQEVMKIISSLSVLDEVTKLYNLQGFQTLSKQQMRLAARNSRPVVVISMDLQRLKWIDVTWGSKEGDRAMATAAQILRATLRESDIIARIDEDEFAFTAIPGNEADIDIILGRLILNMKNFNDQKSLPFPIWLSFGVAVSDPQTPGERLSFEKLLENARQNRIEQKAKEPAE